MTEQAELVDETRLLAVFRALSAEPVSYAVFGGVALGCTAWSGRLPTWIYS